MPRATRPLNPTPNSSLAARTGWIGSVSRFWAKTYAPDYVGLVLLLAAYLLIHFLMEPFHRLFFINNINIQYPHAKVERVSTGWNIFYAGGVPLAILIVALIITRSSFHKGHVTILGFFISLILTAFVTNVIKNAVGRPRPDLISRCKPASATPKNVLVDIGVCTETNHHVLHDGWRSFPSGHSSFAFAGLGFLTLFFCGQMHILHPRADLGKVLLAIAPLIWAALIAISRCEDYRHDVYDVTCGAILGMGITHFCYRRYYPRLRSRKCDQPFDSRDVTFNEGFAKIQNDEETGRAAEVFDLSDVDDEDGD